MKIYNLKDKLEFLDEVVRLEYEEWADDKDNNKEERLKKKKDQIINLFSNEYFCKLILVNDDKLIGFISIFPHDSEEEPELTPWYATMYVKKEYRKQGNSKILNNAILNEAKKRNIPRLYLKTNLVNYYEKFGAIFIKQLNNGENLYKIEINNKGNNKMKNIGLKRGYLELMDYREDYSNIYEQEKEELLNIYKDKITYIDHVGSTSIKNIKSKPIIDILIQTDNLNDFIKFTESNVEGEIYTVKKEQTLGGDYLIRKEEDGKVKAFIHVYKTGDMNGITSIMFRDYLNAHEDEKERYETLKLELYEKYKDERKKYTQGKDKYIKEVIEKAVKEINKKYNY